MGQPLCGALPLPERPDVVRAVAALEAACGACREHGECRCLWYAAVDAAVSHECDARPSSQPGVAAVEGPARPMGPSSTTPIT